jgi:hypothetical protein
MIAVWNQQNRGTQVVRFLIEDSRLLLKPAESRIRSPDSPHPTGGRYHFIFGCPDASE